ncbi:ASCH domain-containing protein [Staphylococcus xylosus]|uniref:ASCH domain-containing protein n=1 Tax=Staphylococcus xylosus TaxID=1288 RepID=UPI001CDBF503|nr:ASCH domain-containing protein [Staphylococcus xylosus]UBV34354.1 ASCH domain-containing protein [Staphylococcus xylosus]
MAVTVEQYWRKFIEAFPEYKGIKFEAWSFGVDEDELAKLVKQGDKTATTSGYEAYKVEDEPLPQVGEVSVILNEKGHPQCVIQTTRVYQNPFNEVTEHHAYLEGEGDKSLAYWRKAHIDFFKPYYESLGLTFNESIIVVCEEFKLLYV